MEADRQSNIFNFTLFADDTSLFYTHKKVHEAVEIMNNELAKISEWLAAISYLK